LSLWTNRDFAVFWAVQTVSELGNGFALVALPLLVLDATGSVQQMGLLTAVGGVASVVTGLFAGGLADRFDRRRLMIVADAARVVLFGLVPVCWAIRPQVWPLFLVMALASVFAMIFQITYVTAVPNLVDRDQIVDANGRLEATNALAFITGPMLAGVVAARFGPTAAIGINAASFAVSVAGLAVVRLRPARRRAEPPARWHNLREGFLTGLVFLWRTPVLRALTILLSVITFLSLGMTDVFIFHLRHGLGEDERVVGYVLGVAGLGTVVAAALTPRLRRSLGFGPCWLGSIVLAALALAGLGFAGRVTAVAGLVFGYAFGMALGGVCSMSLRQAVTPDHLLGRVTAAFWTVHTALGPLGAAVLTGLVGAVGVRGPLLGAAAVLLAVVVAGLLSPIRQRHPERPPAATVAAAATPGAAATTPGTPGAAAATTTPGAASPGLHDVEI
jgi:MFS family permease